VGGAKAGSRLEGVLATTLRRFCGANGWGWRAPKAAGVRQGELGEQFYIIKSGRVEVTAHNEHGQSTVVRTMGPGDFFGEISLLTGEPRSATVTALEDAEMLVINKEDMRCMLEQNHELAAYVSDVLARRQDYLVQQWTQSEGSSHQSDGNQEKHVASLRQEILDKIVAFFSY